MIKKKIISIILAGGKGSRLKGKTPKVLLRIKNRTLINSSIQLARKFSNNTNIVINKSLIFLKKKFSYCNFFIQKKSLGTGHAVLICLKKLNLRKSLNFLILYADTPFVSEKDINKMLAMINYTDLVLLAFKTKDNKGCGLIKKNGKTISQIIEYKNANKLEKKINLCNSGVMLFNQKIGRLVKDIKMNKKTKEFYLTDLVKLANKKKMKIRFVISENELKSRGINDLKTFKLNKKYFQKII